jgi:energy-coupling factor transport system ATP-binding protein
MSKKTFDFSGYATRVDLKCSDGAIIREDAFKHQNGETVPLVWQHLHNGPENILGHAMLEHRKDGVYAYASFNDSKQGLNAKELVRHGDVKALSIYANKLVRRGVDVLHGAIREVSLVLSGANPGAYIDNVVIAHGDSYETSEDEAIIYTGLSFEIQAETIEHADYSKEPDMAEKTVAMLAGEIGYVFQNPDDQIFKYHVIDEVMFGPQNIGMTKEQAKEKAVAALKLVGLEQLADENPYDLELSERKLVAIASVLAMDTKVLILDEPTIAQDWKGRKIIQKMIRDLSSQGKTVIAILHDMDFVAESFERVIVMAHGKVLADGTKEEVFAQKDVLEQARIDQPYLTKLCQQLGYKKLYFSLKD